MAIVFTCNSCGKRFEVPENLAGKTGKCRQCGALFKIPTPTPTPAAGRAGPRFDAYGFDEDSSSAAAPPLPPRADDEFAPIPRRGVQKPPKKKKKRSSGDSADVPALVSTVFLLGTAAVCVLAVLAGFASGHGFAYFTLAAVMLYFVLMMVGGFWTWGLAFRESFVCGLLFFVPFYSLYYTFTRYDEAKYPFRLVFTAIALMITASVLTSTGMVQGRAGQMVAQVNGIDPNTVGANPPFMPNPNAGQPNFNPPIPQPNFMPPQAPRPGGPNPTFGNPGNMPAPPNFPGPRFGMRFGPRPRTGPPSMPAPDPAKTAQIVVENLPDEQSRKWAVKRLGESLQGYVSGWAMTWTHEGSTATISVWPITDMGGLSERLNFGTVTHLDVGAKRIEMIARLPSKEEMAAYLGPEPSKPADAPSGSEADHVPADADFATAMIAQLKSPDKSRRHDAIRKIKGAPPSDDPEKRARVAQALEAMLGDPDGFTRSDAIKALSVWGGPENTPALVKTLADPEFGVRWAALDAFAVIADPAAAEAVAAFLDKDGGKASKALKAMGPKAQTPVWTYLKHENVFVRCDACKVLAVIGTVDSVPPLMAIARRGGRDFDVKEANTALYAIRDRDPDGFKKAISAKPVRAKKSK